MTVCGAADRIPIADGFNAIFVLWIIATVVIACLSLARIYVFNEAQS